MGKGSMRMGVGDRGKGSIEMRVRVGETDKRSMGDRDRGDGDERYENECGEDEKAKHEDECEEDREGKYG